IASCHALAPNFEATDWPHILNLYDLLLAVQPSPVVALNRAVALAMVDGPDAGLAALEAVQGEPALGRDFLLSAARRELLRRRGDFQEAAANFGQALELAGCEPVRRFLERKRRECEEQS